MKIIMRFLKLFTFCFKINTIEQNRLLYHYVCKKNHKKVIKLLKQGADPNTTISYNTPIDIAIHDNDLIMIKILIFYGANLNDIDLSRLLCNDCRNNFQSIKTIFDIKQKILHAQFKTITKKYNIPYGLDNYLKSFLIK